MEFKMIWYELSSTVHYIRLTFLQQKEESMAKTEAAKQRVAESSQPKSNPPRKEPKIQELTEEEAKIIESSNTKNVLNAAATDQPNRDASLPSDLKEKVHNVSLQLYAQTT